MKKIFLDAKLRRKLNLDSAPEKNPGFERKRLSIK